MQKETKKIIYKHAQGAPEGQTLQSCLIAALRRFNRPGLRLEAMGVGGSEVRFVSYYRTNHQATIGVFHKLTKGKAQEIIQMVGDKDEWSVTPMPAKAIGKEGAEFIEGTLFFSVWKNHVLIHQSSSCRADAFQEHLSWLLSKPASGEEEGGEAVLIGLDDPMPPSFRGRSKMQVTKLELGGVIQSRPVAGKATTTTKRADVTFEPSGPLWKAILGMLKQSGAKIPDNLTMKDSLTGKDLRVAMQLYCSKKNADSAAGQVIGQLGHVMSHVKGSNYVVHLADGTKITSDSMKVSHLFGIECEDKHPVHQHLFKVMLEYFTLLVNDETIQEEEPFGNTK